MKIETIWRKAAAATLAMGLALLLTGCFLSPGKFTSALDLRKDGHFTFNYKGEIYLLGLSRLASLAKAAGGDEEFTAKCYDDENFEETECSEEEVAEQKKQWDEAQVAKKAEDERNTKAFSALFGGIDPSDPDAAEEIAAKLRRQKGWNSVVHRGDGLFEVDFSVASKIDHDFTFPVLEGFPLSNSFVIATVRNGNTIRIEAPGYAAQSTTSNPTSSLMLAAGALGAAAEETDPDKELKVPELDGSFTITTDGTILANNTDEGPAAAAGGQKLFWAVTTRSAAAPMALIKLGN